MLVMDKIGEYKCKYTANCTSLPTVYSSEASQKYTEMSWLGDIIAVVVLSLFSGTSIHIVDFRDSRRLQGLLSDMKIHDARLLCGCMRQ